MKFSDSPEYQKLYEEWNAKINQVPIDKPWDKDQQDLFNQERKRKMGNIQLQEGTSTIPDMIKILDKEEL